MSTRPPSRAATRDPTATAHLCTVDHDQRGATRVALYGELDRVAAERLDVTLHDLARQTQELILDLSGVSFIDCWGLFAILRWHQACRDSACSLTLLHPSEQVCDLLARVGLLDRLTVIEARPVPGEHAGGRRPGSTFPPARSTP
jgi:anti-sigma B factor antagonist